MNFFRKYGIYFVLLVATATLGGVGYINESRKEMKEEKTVPQEITYVPKEVTVIPEVTPETAETVKEVLSESETPSPTPQEEAKKVVYTKPVVGDPIAQYSGDSMIFSETMDDFRTHNGLDYPCNSGEEIKSAAEGAVTDIYEDDFLGLCLQIEHPDGIITKYCALAETKVNVGDKIESGSTVAIAGNSANGESAQGIHLHFEALKEGKNIDPQTLFN